MTPVASGQGPLAGALARLSEGESLSENEAADAMRAIVDGRAAPGEIGAYLAALRDKGETVAEIGAAFAARQAPFAGNRGRRPPRVRILTLRGHART